MNSRVQLPDGTDIGWSLPGSTFLQKIDNWFSTDPNAKPVPIHEQDRPAHPRATVGLWQVSQPSASQYQWATLSRIEEVLDDNEVKSRLEINVEEQEDDAVLAAAQAVIDKRATCSLTKNV